MERKWWHNKVAYQIYPKSFNDTNGDGIGDIKGIIDKLDYLKELGIDIIWISPIYQSPFVDQGYDISDYYRIDEKFGTMEDFDTLLEEAKSRDMHIVMDLVINHCSNKHEWFQKALENPTGKYGDYFYFRKGKDGNPTSNYRSYFGGSAWEKVEGTDLYYLHMFAKEQPDLNWYNKEVLDELYKMINWWLDKGVSGFRIDAIINIAKDLNFENLEPDGEDGLVHAGKVAEHATGIGSMLEDLKKNTFEKHDAFTVGEVFNMKKDELGEFIGENGHFSSMFDFSAQCLSFGEHGWYDAPDFTFEQYRNAIFNAQKESEDVGFLSNIIENHDEPRGASRYLPEHARNDQGTKMLGTIIVLLRGIPFIYQGQEIGMTNTRFEDISEYDDINTINEYNLAIEAGKTKEEAMDICYKHSRDNGRTPMQWSGEKNAGFTTGKPWLKVNPLYKHCNVAAQLEDENSVLSYYKKVIALRKHSEYSDLFVYGKTVPVFTDKDYVFAYKRILKYKAILVIANFGKEEITLNMEKEKWKVLLNNMKEYEILGKQLVIKSCQALVME